MCYGSLLGDGNNPEELMDWDLVKNFGAGALGGTSVTALFKLIKGYFELRKELRQELIPSREAAIDLSSKLREVANAYKREAERTMASSYDDDTEFGAGYTIYVFAPNGESHVRNQQ